MLFPTDSRSRKLSCNQHLQSTTIKLKKGLAYNLINSKRRQKYKSQKHQSQREPNLNTSAKQKKIQHPHSIDKQNAQPTQNKLIDFAIKPSKIIFVNQLQQRKEKRAESLNQTKFKLTLVFHNLKKSDRLEPKEGENRNESVVKRIESSKNIRIGSKIRQKTSHDIEKESDIVQFQNFLLSSALSSQRGKGSGKIQKVSNSIPELLEKQLLKINIFGLKAMEADLVDHFRLKTAGQGIRIRSKKINRLMEDSVGNSSKII